MTDIDTFSPVCQSIFLEYTALKTAVYGEVSDYAELHSLLLSYGLVCFSRGKFEQVLSVAPASYSVRSEKGALFSFTLYRVPIPCVSIGITEDVVMVEIPGIGFLGPDPSARDTSVIGQDLYNFFSSI